MHVSVILAVLMTIVGLGCSSSSTVSTTVATGIPEQGFAPNFRFSLYQGGDIIGSETKQLVQLRGMPVVLNFWARLCPPCWTEMPELQKFSEEFEGEIILLSIDIGQFTGLGAPRDASKLLDAMGVTYPVGFTDDGLIVEEYEVLAMPTTVFIDRHGKIFQKWTGAIDRDSITGLAKSMLMQDGS